jgi:thiol-disulfide isomerase/thioredoxin
MKVLNWLGPRATFAALLLTAYSSILSGIDTREPAPRFTARTLDGEKFTNEALKGRVVLLQFWATWCRYCRADQDAVDAIAGEFANRGLVVLAVNVGESKKKVRQYLEDSPRASKIVLTEDTNLSAIFAAKAYPMYVLIDRDGKIIATQRGAAGEDSLRRMLSKAGLGTE